MYLNNQSHELLFHLAPTSTTGHLYYEGRENHRRQWTGPNVYNDAIEEEAPITTMLSGFNT